MIYDDIDREILEILNRDGRTKFTTIAKSIKRTEGTVRNRVRRLREKGVIQGFRVVTDPVNLGYEKQAIIRFQMEPHLHRHDVIRHLINQPEDQRKPCLLPFRRFYHQCPGCHTGIIFVILSVTEF